MANLLLGAIAIEVQEDKKKEQGECYLIAKKIRRTIEWYTSHNSSWLSTKSVSEAIDNKT